MYKLCKTEASAERQHLLEEGLLAAMSRQHYDDISVSELCEQLQIPRKVFYRYFSGKEGALQALLEHTLMECLSYLRGKDLQGRNGYRDLENFFFFWKEKKELLDALVYSDLTGLLVQRVLDMAVREISLPFRYLAGESKFMQEHMIRFCICGIMMMVFRWHENGYKESAAQMAQVAARLLTQPLIRNPEMLI